MRIYKLHIVIFIVLLLVVNLNIANVDNSHRIDLTGEDPTSPLLNQGPKVIAVGDEVMVSTQSFVATEAALQVLKKGGNAVDAAITSVFLQHVTEYNQVMHFGCMAGLFYEAATGKYYAFNAVGDRPLASRGKSGDPMKVSIGGTVRGLEELWKRFGSRPWASYLKPAIAAAEEGVLVTSFMYAQNYHLFEGKDISRGRGDLAQNEEARKFYMPDGFLVPVGKHWKMPKLAKHLRKVASEGADYLYTGEWGQKFVREANKAGGRVTIDDMADYKVRWLEPLSITYRGYEIITEPPPVYGGLKVAYSLNILENFDLTNTGHFTESAETLEIMSRTFGRVESEIRWLQDPQNFHVPIELLLSKAYGEMGAEFVKKTRLLPKAKLLSKVKSDYAVKDNQSSILNNQEISNYSSGSNATVIVDSKGNWITFLHTGHGGAPGVFIDGVRATGSNMPSETFGKGRRLLFPSAATFIAKKGKPWLALGTPGSPPQPVTEVIVNILDFGMEANKAADAPRFWAFRDLSRTIQVESRVSETLRKEISAKGIKIHELTDYNWHTGSFQIIWFEEKNKKLFGATDPRRLGYSAGF